jgi:hypothetical protein
MLRWAIDAGSKTRAFRKERKEEEKKKKERKKEGKPSPYFSDASRETRKMREQKSGKGGGQGWVRALGQGQEGGGEVGREEWREKKSVKEADLQRRFSGPRGSKLQRH